MNLEALFDAVIVKPIENEEVTYGGIIVPDMGKELNEVGEVLAVGPGKHTHSGPTAITSPTSFNSLPISGTIIPP